MSVFELFQNVVNLKKIDLWDSKHLVELPDLSKAKNLQKVNLVACASICEVHPSILSHNKLRELSLSDCVALTSLKSEIESGSLSYIFLDGCSNLKEFYVIAKNLTFLALFGTAIEEVPSCIGHMSKLRFPSYDKSLRHIESNIFDPWLFVA